MWVKLDPVLWQKFKKLAFSSHRFFNILHGEYILKNKNLMLVVVQTSEWKFSLSLKLRTRYVIEKQTYLLKVLVIHTIFRAKHWLSLKK